MSSFIEHAPCEECGSSDAKSIYDDGHGYCFACETHFPAPTGGNTGKAKKVDQQTVTVDTTVDQPSASKAKLLPIGSYDDIPARGLSKETCRKYGYSRGLMGGNAVHIATYYNSVGEPIAQKVRDRHKNFKFLGDAKQAPMYGSHLFKEGGKRLVITEGEIDCLTISQLQNNKWPVVSLPNGAAAAARSISHNLQWLLTFDTVILCFDNDEPGKKAVNACVQLFPAGKCCVANLPEGIKDPNDGLLQGRSAEIIECLWNAQPYRPQGIITVDELMEELEKPLSKGIPWWSETLTELTHGRRYGEIYCIGAGTGVGKTDFLTQQIAHDVMNDIPVGVFFFEQEPVETVRRIAGKLKGRKFHIPDSGFTKEEFSEAIGTLRHSNLQMYNHFGAIDWPQIESTIRYMRHADNVRVFYIDHLTALAAGAEEDERTALEKCMSAMGRLVKELDIMIILVSHLSTPEGKSHEEGGRVTIRHFKGSRSIGFWCHFMFGLERDQQENNGEGVTTFRVLKDRYTGQAVGKTIPLSYDHVTGLLREEAMEAPFNV